MIDTLYTEYLDYDTHEPHEGKASGLPTNSTTKSSYHQLVDVSTSIKADI